MATQFSRMDLHSCYGSFEHCPRAYPRDAAGAPIRLPHCIGHRPYCSGRRSDALRPVGARRPYPRVRPTSVCRCRGPLEGRAGLCPRHLPRTDHLILLDRWPAPSQGLRPGHAGGQRDTDPAGLRGSRGTARDAWGAQSSPAVGGPPTPAAPVPGRRLRMLSVAPRPQVPLQL